MARHEVVDETLLRQLAQHHAAPVVTVSVPTHRFGPSTTQDRVLMLDLIGRLALDHDLRAWPEGTVALERLRHEAELVDAQRALDGLVLYASARGAGHLALSVPVTPRTTVGTHIALGPVIEAVQSLGRALVVDVNEAGARAWWKVGPCLTEILDSGFPYQAEPEDRLGRSRWDFGRQRTTVELTRRRHVVDDVVGRVTTLLDERHLPVFAGGNAKSVALLASDRRLQGRLSSYHLRATNHAGRAELTRAAHDIDEHLRQRRDQHWALELAKARDARRLATDLDEITQLVNDGNAAALLLASGSPSTDDHARAVRLDHVMATMIGRGHDVAIVAGATLGTYGPHALITRH